MGGERDDFFGCGVAGQAHDSGVTEVGVAVVIFLEEGDEVAGAVGGWLATKGDGGEGADPEAGILEEREERRAVGERGFSKSLGGLSADDVVGIFESPDEEVACRFALLLASEHSQSPDAVKSFGGIEPLVGGGNEDGQSVLPTCQMVLSAEAKAEVRVGEEFCEIVGALFGDSGGDDFCDFIAGVGLLHGVDPSGLV